MPPGNGPHARSGSPSGGSILVTSAPRAAKSFAAYGPEISEAISTTYSTARGPVIPGSPGHPDRFRLHVLVQSADPAALPAESAQLEAAERRVTGTDSVDRDLAGADALGHADGPV